MAAGKKRLTLRHRAEVRSPHHVKDVEQSALERKRQKVGSMFVLAEVLHFHHHLLQDVDHGVGCDAVADRDARGVLAYGLVLQVGDV